MSSNIEHVKCGRERYQIMSNDEDEKVIVANEKTKLYSQVFANRAAAIMAIMTDADKGRLRWTEMDAIDWSKVDNGI